jgi:hypothetical protein
MLKAEPGSCKHSKLRWRYPGVGGSSGEEGSPQAVEVFSFSSVRRSFLVIPLRLRQRSDVFFRSFPVLWTKVRHPILLLRGIRVVKIGGAKASLRGGYYAGRVAVTDALSTSGYCSTPESRSTKQYLLRFYAVLTNDSQEVCFDRLLGYG